MFSHLHLVTQATNTLYHISVIALIEWEYCRAERGIRKRQGSQLMTSTLTNAHWVHCACPLNTVFPKYMS